MSGSHNFFNLEKFFFDSSVEIDQDLKILQRKLLIILVSSQFRHLQVIQELHKENLEQNSRYDQYLNVGEILGVQKLLEQKVGHWILVKVIL